MEAYADIEGTFVEVAERRMGGKASGSRQRSNVLVGNDHNDVCFGLVVGTVLGLGPFTNILAVLGRMTPRNVDFLECVVDTFGVKVVVTRDRHFGSWGRDACANGAAKGDSLGGVKQSRHGRGRAAT